LNSAIHFTRIHAVTTDFFIKINKVSYHVYVWHRVFKNKDWGAEFSELPTNEDDVSDICYTQDVFIEGLSEYPDGFGACGDYSLRLKGNKIMMLSTMIYPTSLMKYIGSYALDFFESKSEPGLFEYLDTREGIWKRQVFQWQDASQREIQDLRERLKKTDP
jgi:hypothetical protein